MTKKRENEPAEKPRRRRRKPEAAESEILDAAESFLKEHPFREMTIDDVMSRTGLSRPSFYEYFRDRHHLVMKLTERLGGWNYSGPEPWVSGEVTLDNLRTGLERVVELYSSRGYLLRALSEAATHDPQVEAAYRKMLSDFIGTAADRIRLAPDRGAMQNLDPLETATALVLMNERYLIERLGSQPQSEPELITKTLLTIWQRVLFPDGR